MKKIEVNGKSFEYAIAGREEPICVFLSGYDETIETWNEVLPEVENYGKVFLYNRLGVGGSDRATRFQCGETVIDDLRKMLASLKVMPPYILIGHSIGGLFVNLYGCLYPDEISAAILIEPTHPDHDKRLDDCSPPIHVQLVNGFLNVLEGLHSWNKHTEMKSFENTVQQLICAGAFPNVPLSVVAGNKKMPFEPDGLRDLHLRNQQDMASISEKGKLVVAKRSGHFPQVSEPELVSGIIVQMIR